MEARGARWKKNEGKGTLCKRELSSIRGVGKFWKGIVEQRTSKAGLFKKSPPVWVVINEKGTSWLSQEKKEKNRSFAVRLCAKREGRGSP